MLERPRVVILVLVAGGLIHLAIGFAGLAFPRWFFHAAPPWPPIHVGQIQIAGVFDLALAALFLGAARDLERYFPLAVLVGVVAETGHALVRIGHIVGGSNPASDLVLPLLMLSFAAILVLAGFCRGLALKHAA
jgi:hypothetical protein